MIAKVFSFILGIINFIVMLVIRLILTVFPVIDITGFSAVFSAFFRLLEGATAMTYFLVGDMTNTFITAIGTIWTAKHIALPVINFVRKFITH